VVSRLTTIIGQRLVTVGLALEIPSGLQELFPTDTKCWWPEGHRGLSHVITLLFPISPPLSTPLLAT
jgi:hypothetical protein